MYGHDKKCLAASVIAAVENCRDYENFSTADFARVVGLEKYLLGTAVGYLNDGLMECRCEERFACWACSTYTPLAVGVRVAGDIFHVDGEVLVCPRCANNYDGEIA